MDPLATPAELADYTGGKFAEDDPRVSAAIEGVSQAIRMYCGWHVTPVILDTITLDGPGGRYLTLPTKRLVALNSIREDGILIDPTDYKWSEDGTVRRRARYWSEDFRDIRVELMHGFDDVPDLKQVALGIVARQLASPLGAIQEQAGGVSVRWSETVRGVSGGMAILAHEYASIDPYRLEVV